MAAADLAASSLRSGTDDARIGLLETLVQRVDLAADGVLITLCAAGVTSTLGTPPALKSDMPALPLSLPAVRTRRGQQMRLVVPGPEEVCAPRPARRDERLITLVADAFQARELVLAHPGRSTASIASENGRCRTRLAKLVELSCLAPDIVTAIAEGRQPETLTARRLSATSLPLEWARQRQALGFA